MEQNEPSTKEIVRALLNRSVDKKSFYRRKIELIAADRLESQEREIVGLTELNKAEYVLYKSEIDAYRIASESLKLTILRYMDMTQTLTARAEQAEKERDAAVAEFDVIAQDGLCEVCFFGDFSEVSKDTCMEDCCFQWRNKKRGLAQKGNSERCRVEF